MSNLTDNQEEQEQQDQDWCASCGKDFTGETELHWVYWYLGDPYCDLCWDARNRELGGEDA